MSKLMYNCECCNYFTESNQSIKRHVSSERHKKAAEPINYVCNVNNKIKIYPCKVCGREFKVLSTKFKHQKLCKLANDNTHNSDENVLENFVDNKHSQQNHEIPIIEPQVQLPNQLPIQLPIQSTQPIQPTQSTQPDINFLIQLLAQQLMSQQTQQTQQAQLHSNQMNTMAQVIGNTIKEAIEKSCDTAKVSVEQNARVAIKSMGMIKYASLKLNKAPPLKPLEKDQIYGILGYDGEKKGLTSIQKEQENEKFVKIVVGRYENKDLVNFLSEMIVKYFKDKSTNENNEFDIELSPLWSVDVARLSFIIMQTVNKQGEKVWKEDKSGHMFTAMVTTPMLETLDSIIREYIKYSTKRNSKIAYLTTEQMDYAINMDNYCGKILNDIKYNKFKKQILKKVAPHFKFDEYLKDDTPTNNNFKKIEFATK